MERNDMSEDKKHRWIAIVYDDTDKIGARLFDGYTEEEVRPIAQQWVDAKYGEGRDWALHCTPQR